MSNPHTVLHFTNVYLHRSMFAKSRYSSRIKVCSKTIEESTHTLALQQVFDFFFIH